MYKQIIKPILFLKQPEEAHYTMFNVLKKIHLIPGVGLLMKKIFETKHLLLETKLWDITFPNPVGLAAGLDKDAVCIDELSNFGFGFIEIGTLTPKAQAGNEKPRLFRLIADQAIINRMGFNNQGVSSAQLRLAKRKSKIIVGGNIGKNKTTSNEDAVKDYVTCMQVLHPFVDYFTVNVSSPNTPGLRELQDKEPLSRLLKNLVEINQGYSKPKPILLKIAPDLSSSQLDDIVEIVFETKIDGLIATNTTLDRSNLISTESELKNIGAGGLSGKPLNQKSTEIIKYLAQKSNHKFPIIAVGGIHNAQDAIDKIKAGASLVQIYTGLIYEGPSLVKEINKKIIQLRKNTK